MISIIVIALGTAAIVGATVAREQVLDSDFYADALETNDIYDRIYAEALADPELERTVGRLLGGFDVEPSVQVALIRQVLPPNDLRLLVERVLTRLVAYLAGDVDSLEVAVDLSSMLQQIEPATSAYVRERVDRLNTTELPDLDSLVAELEPFGAELARGEIPNELLPLADIVPAQAPIAALRILGVIDVPPPPELIRQVEAAIAAGDTRGAVILAAEHFASPSVRASLARLRDGLAPGGKLLLLRVAAENGGGTGRRVVAELDTARRVANWSSQLLIAGILLLGAGLGGMVWWCRVRDISIAVGFAAAAFAAGAGALALWAAVVIAVDIPLEAARDGRWDVPAPVRTMLTDVFSTMGDELTSDVLTPAVILFGLGGVVAGHFVLWRLGLLDLRSRRRRQALIAGAGAFALIVVAIVVTTERIIHEEPERACNGHSQLCDRQLNEVVFAGTHNSMSSADRGWIWPEHDRGIAAQLDAGIRLLLIDAHYWEDADDVLSALARLPDPPSSAVVDVVTRFVEPRPGAFLCHRLCRLGATPLVDGLQEINRFMARNPDEVIVVFVEDHVTSRDFEIAMGRADLLDDVYVHDPDAGWPTLGEMIDNQQRLFVLAERTGPPPSWFHHGFELVQDTPYEFSGVADFSCAHNRGHTDNSLFLMNHWIDRTAPSRADANAANDRRVIVDRAHRCADERGLAPNLIAVNFASIGGLLGAVDELNGV